MPALAQIISWRRKVVKALLNDDLMMTRSSDAYMRHPVSGNHILGKSLATLWATNGWKLMLKATRDVCELKQNINWLCYQRESLLDHKQVDEKRIAIMLLYIKITRRSNWSAYREPQELLAIIITTIKDNGGNWLHTIPTSRTKKSL